jgi:hypothetical protein
MPSPLQPERQRTRYCATVLPDVHPTQGGSSGLHTPRPPRCRMALVVEENKALGPLYIRPCRSDMHVFSER